MIRVPIVQDPHKKYERKQLRWLLMAYLIIGTMAAAIMLYAAAPILWPEYFR
jgi:hypothetical protein